jgi:hypothetical protein
VVALRAVVVLAAVGFCLALAEGQPSRNSKIVSTFSTDIAPIIFQKCAYCHRPGQAAPFSLLNYNDVRKRAEQIAEVTARRYMPPWLPEPGYGNFADSRRLTDSELQLVQQWIASGCAEGDPAATPQPPHYSDSWELGRPDLIVSFPEYVLSATGKDVYRNLVAPLNLASNCYVRGVELLPGNSKVVHHAFVNVDETRFSRNLAAKTDPPGFDGMDLPESVTMPEGQLLGWQPGKRPSFNEPGLSWVLKTNMDLVLQMHFHPSGKPEIVAPKVGLYFTDQPPTTAGFRIRLVRFDFEIPPGSTNYLVEQSYTLPVDVQLLRILPHCHYLGKDLRAFAELPNGEKRWLIWIRDWDFNWQGDYKYASPVTLPKGSRLVMQFTYDNSTNNVRNPNSPPVTVRHGLQTTDEMAAVALQAVTRTLEERQTLAADYSRYFLQVSVDSYEFRLRINPKDSEAHLKLGRYLAYKGQTDEALAHLRTAAQLQPADDRAYYELGFIHLRQGRLRDAYLEFVQVVRLNPNDFQAYGSLGYICMLAGLKKEARHYLEAALRLNPDDPVSRGNLERVAAMADSPRQDRTPGASP